MNKKGFALIEALCVVLILAAGVSASISYLGDAGRQGVELAQATQAKIKQQRESDLIQVRAALAVASGPERPLEEMIAEPQGEDNSWLWAVVGGGVVGAVFAAAYHKREKGE